MRDGLPNKSWKDVLLGVNVVTQRVFPLLHYTGDKVRCPAVMPTTSLLDEGANEYRDSVTAGGLTCGFIRTQKLCLKQEIRYRKVSQKTSLRPLAE